MHYNISDQKNMKKSQKAYSGHTAGRIKKRVIILTFLSGLSILLVLSYIYLSQHVFCKQNNPLGTEVSVQTVERVSEPTFIKEGELIFLSKKTKAKIIQIDIEIADTPHELATGLMYRHSMLDTAGMLFIYEWSQPLFFWMKNTYIPLDIIFVDESMQIVEIQKNTKPLSEELIPSLRNARYVVEVNAGFCNKHCIEIGDYITYDKTL